MSQIFLREVQRLKELVLDLCTLVEEAVERAVRAVEGRDAALARAVIEGDCRIDELEVQLQEECFKIVALHQPVAVDLRFVVAVIKFNNDLERIGDLAVNVAERALELSAAGAPPCPFDFGAMADAVRKLVRRSLDALIQLDVALARRVMNMDDEVDRLHWANFRQIEEAIRAEPQRVGTMLQYLSLSRYLERMADQATNVAEDVVYIVEGDIVRHRGAGD